jgi:hypothetical protein
LSIFSCVMLDINLLISCLLMCTSSYFIHSILSSMPLENSNPGKHFPGFSSTLPCWLQVT